MNIRAQGVRCRQCGKEFKTGFYKESVVIYHLKNFYMLRQIERIAVRHFSKEHPKETPICFWLEIVWNALGGYSKAFIQDLFMWPLIVVGLIWHLITIVFVRVDNLMWGEWLW